MYFEDKHIPLLEHCAKNNPDSFNMNKAIEESLEFCEAMVKRQTKHKTNPKRPDKEELIKEYGDLIYRGMIYIMQQFPGCNLDDLESSVKAHINKKLTSLQGWKDQGKYDGGL